MIGLPLLAIAAVLVWKVPPWLVRRADKAAGRCIEHVEQNAGDPAECAPGLGLSVAGVFPHAKPEAAKTRAKIERSVARIQLERAMKRGPDAAGRSQALRAFIAARGDNSIADWLVDVGALPELAALDVGNTPSYRRHPAAFAALALGDVANARAKLATGTFAAERPAIETGALACLLGEHERGLALLAWADRRGRLDGSDADAAARIAAIHCGGTEDKLGYDPMAVSSAYELEPLIARAFDPAFQKGRRTTVGLTLVGETTIFAPTRLATIALAAGSEQELGLQKLLEVIAPDFQPFGFSQPLAATPWSVLADDATGYGSTSHVPPSWLELAAERCAKAAATAPAKLDFEMSRIDGAALAKPREHLRAAAIGLYKYAAMFRIRMGHRAGAKAAIERARALDPAQLGIAPLLLAAGDPKGALASIDAWQAAHGATADALGRDVAGINQVLALLALGDAAKAHATAKTLKSAEGHWLLLATSILTKQPIQPNDFVRAEETYELTSGVVATAIVKKQIPPTTKALTKGDSVLPAAVFVIAHAARAAGANPDVVLDDYFDDELASRHFAYARAEAARWAGEAETAKLWQTRGETIEKLFATDAAAALATIAGIQ